jgi:hypothetical protein
MEQFLQIIFPATPATTKRFAQPGMTGQVKRYFEAVSVN